MLAHRFPLFHWPWITSLQADKDTEVSPCFRRHSLAKQERSVEEVITELMSDSCGVE